jgi:hypothetical protein
MTTIASPEGSGPGSAGLRGPRRPPVGWSLTSSAGRQAAAGPSVADDPRSLHHPVDVAVRAAEVEPAEAVDAARPGDVVEQLEAGCFELDPGRDDVADDERRDRAGRVRRCLELRALRVRADDLDEVVLGTGRENMAKSGSS